MAALRRERLPPAPWPFCFVAYGLFWAVYGPFFGPWLGSPTSVSKTLGSQAEAASLPYWWTREHRLQLCGLIYKLSMQ